MAGGTNSATLRNRGLTAILVLALVGFGAFLLRAVDEDAEPMSTWQLVEMSGGASSERTLIVIHSDAHDPERFLALYCNGRGITARIGVGARASGDLEVTVSRAGEAVLDGTWSDDGSGAHAASPEKSAELAHLLLDTSDAVQLHASGRGKGFSWKPLTVPGFAAGDMAIRVRDSCQLDRRQ